MHMDAPRTALSARRPDTALAQAAHSASLATAWTSSGTRVTLTRDLDAAMVIDRATGEEGAASAAGFEKRPDMPIRGRRETQDAYALLMLSES